MNIVVIGRDQEKCEYSVNSPEALYRKLVEELKVEGICGGVCSCATCHVYVHHAVTDVFTPLSDDEEDALSGLINRKPNSRLLCQLKAEKDCPEQISIELAPEE